MNTVTVRWVCKHHQELEAAELYAILALRAQVFVVEQYCIYQDVDGRDLTGATHHLMAWDGQHLAAYARLLETPEHPEHVSIGRIVTAPAVRGHGLGHTLLQVALAQAGRLWSGRPVYLSAQSHLQAFYRAHGFSAVTGEYLEDDIPHIGMQRPAV